MAFLLYVPISVEAKKPRPTPTPTTTPTTTQTPSPTPSPTPTPTPGTANLVLSVSAPSTLQSGEFIPYTITVTNIGPDDARDVQFCSLLDPGEMVLIELNQGTWDTLIMGGASGRYTNCSTWGRETLLPSGASVYMSYTIALQPNQTTQINTVETSGYNLDPDWSNNSATISTSISQ